MKTICENCSFYRRQDNDSGECRKNAPLGMLATYYEFSGNFFSWPRVFSADWCGEWTPARGRRAASRNSGQ